MVYRIPDSSVWPADLVDRIVCGDALSTLKELQSETVALIVTSPPYWDLVDYGVSGQIGHSSYDQYLRDLCKVWVEAARVLIPNGKLAIVTPVVPIPKKRMNSQHTRHLKNIAFDIEATILRQIEEFHRFGLFVWKKQTTTKMFGSYPFPPNIYEDNTIEFINVYVKSGAPPPIPKSAKLASKLSQSEWRNLSMQIWPMYPEDVKRTGGHPAPFPVVLPQRLISMYTFAKDAASGFGGDIVLDMFNGSGATTSAANAAGRRWIGVDLNPDYCAHARNRLQTDHTNPHRILLGDVSVKNPTDSRQLELIEGPQPNLL